MENELGLGTINGHIVGRVIKEAVRRATVAIRHERAVFDAHVKQGYGGEMDDVSTSADMKAQKIYVDTLRECFPLCGVVAEENDLRVEPKEGCEAYFTVDPLDGTKAYIRGQSDGVATMIGLVLRGEVIAAYICDINTEEVYSYRPGTQSVYRITRLDTFKKLGREGPIDLKKSHALLRDPLTNYSPCTKRLVESSFKSYDVMGGSIGTWTARLWKGEVSALFMRPGWETPWDGAPIVGISKKLGYVFLRPVPDRKHFWKRYEPRIVTSNYYRDHDTLVLHKSDLPQILLEVPRP